MRRGRKAEEENGSHANLEKLAEKEAKLQIGFITLRLKEKQFLLQNQ